MTDLPAPLVPADVDLRDFPCLPIDIVRLFASEFHARSTDAEWRAGMTLWLKSFHQVPAASLPDDDIALARLAEFGRDQASWLEVKEGALRNWTRCSDGRLYHRTVAVKALEAWIGKVWQRRSGAVGNAKRWKVEADLKEIDTAYEKAMAALAMLEPRSQALTRHRPARSQPESAHVDDASQPDAPSNANPDRNPIPAPSRPDPDPSRDLIASEVKLSEVISNSNELERVPARAADEAPGDDRVVVQLRPKSTRAKKSKPELTQWPENLELTPEGRRYAEVHGYRPDELWEQFRNKSLAKGWMHADWQHAWRNFVLQEVKFDRQHRTAANAPRGRPPDV